MSHPSIEPPSLKSELERKSLEVLDRVVGLESQGRATKQDIAKTASVLWDVTAGLVANDISTLFAGIGAEFSQIKLSRHFVRHESLISFYWFPQKHGFVMSIMNTATRQRVNKAFTDEIGMREAVLEAKFKTLVTAGYLQLD